MPSKVIRNIKQVFRSASGVLFGRKTAGTGRGEELTPADVRTLISVYSASEVDAIIGGIDGLTSADIDTLAEINAILTDADLASITYVDSGLSGKQGTLVSGENIKTINSTSLLGFGDIAVSASPAGSSGQVQYNNAGAFGGTAAIVYASSGVHETITAQGPTIVCGCDKGAASQTANLREFKNSAGANVAHVTAAGEIAGTSLRSTLGGVYLVAYQWLYANGVAHVGIGGGRFYGNDTTQLDRFTQGILSETTSAMWGWGTASPVFGFFRDLTNQVTLRTPAGSRGKLRLGTLNLNSLATSDPVVAGELWNDAGTIKISAG